MTAMICHLAMFHLDLLRIGCSPSARPGGLAQMASARSTRPKRAARSTRLIFARQEGVGPGRARATTHPVASRRPLRSRRLT